MMPSRAVVDALIRPVSLCAALAVACPAAAQDAPTEEAPAAASADPPAGDAPAEAAPTEEAPAAPVDPSQLEAEAKEAMRAGDCQTAADRFDAFADAIESDAARTQEQLTARFLAAVCYERLDQLEEAAEAYRAVIFGEAPPELVEKAEPRLADIEPLLPVQVSFVCEEEGVTITLAAFPDEQKGCDEAWRLPSGDYRGAASATDGREVPLMVRVTPGIPEEVVVLLPAAGRNTIAEAPENPPQVIRNDRTVEWLLTSGAAVALGVGIAFNVVARSAVDRGDEAYGRYERARAIYDEATAAAARVQVEDARDDADAAALTSYIFLGAGVALTGAALWLWLDEPEVSAQTEAGALRIVPGLGGIGLVGQW